MKAGVEEFELRTHPQPTTSSPRNFYQKGVAQDSLLDLVTRANSRPFTVAIDHLCCPEERREINSEDRFLKLVSKKGKASRSELMSCPRRFAIILWPDSWCDFDSVFHLRILGLAFLVLFCRQYLLTFFLNIEYQNGFQNQSLNFYKYLYF